MKITKKRWTLCARRKRLSAVRWARSPTFRGQTQEPGFSLVFRAFYPIIGCHSSERAPALLISQKDFAACVGCPTMGTQQGMTGCWGSYLAVAEILNEIRPVSETKAARARFGLITDPKKDKGQ